MERFWKTASSYVTMLVLVIAVVWLVGAPESLAGKGGGKGGGSQCCNPALEPGTGSNPFCFEGHTCCADGRWRCNNADASAPCAAGSVCGG